MIPTRKRLSGLMNTLASIKETATSPNYEILLRVDDDDHDTQSRFDTLKEMGCRCIVGSRLQGYGSLDKDFYRQLEEDSNGTFVWIASDDMIVFGDWMKALARVPTTGYIVQPAISRLGHSIYPLAEAQAFPIFPRFCWKQFTDKFPAPFDVNGHLLLKAHGWHTWFLEGVTMWHDRPDEEEIAEHRRL